MEIVTDQSKFEINQRIDLEILFLDYLYLFI
jgi:hypothetical protein